MTAFFQKFFFKLKLSNDVAALYSNILIDAVGSGLIGLFFPIFLWQTFGSINGVLVYYLILWIGYLFGVFFGAKLMSVLGLKVAMILSVPFKVLMFLSLYYLSLGYPVIIFTTLLIVVLEIRLMLFWIPYHTGFAQMTDKASRGRVMGLLAAISSLVSICVPLLSGWIISRYDFDVLFLIATIIMAISIMPLFILRQTYERFSFTFIETWRQLFSLEHRRMFMARFADGIENMIGAVIWPIFIFQLLDGDFLKVGALSSFIILTTIIVQLVMGSYTDRIDKRTLIRWGSGLYALGWISKIFVVTGFHIFITSTYHNFTAVMMRTPYDALLYEKAADAGHYVDELTVLREMAMSIGRIVCIIFLIILIGLVGLQWAFILAAIASLFVNIL